LFPLCHGYFSFSTGGVAQDMKHIVSLVIALSMLWLLNSGHYSPLVLFLGAASVALVVFITLAFEIIDREYYPIHITFRLIPYWGWLFKELVLANIDVAKRVWIGKKAIYPVVKTLPVSQSTDMGKVIYANSITLTPGTITVELAENEITVHALTLEGMEALESGEMDRRVKEIE